MPKGVVLCLCLGVGIHLAAQPVDLDRLGFRSADASLTRLFTPMGAAPGIYSAYRLTEGVEAVARRLGGPAGDSSAAWAIEPLSPLDAFGSDTPYDRARLARLYGASRPRVARGAMVIDGCRVAVTLISPVPDLTLSRLEPGTLAIVYSVGRHLEGCV